MSWEHGTSLSTPSNHSNILDMSSNKRPAPRVRMVTGISTPPPATTAFRHKARIVMHGTGHAGASTPTSTRSMSTVSRPPTAVPRTVARTTEPINPRYPNPYALTLPPIPEDALPDSSAPFDSGEQLDSRDVSTIYEVGFEPDILLIGPQMPLITPTDVEADYWNALCVVESIFRLDTHLYVLKDWDDCEQMLKVRTRYVVLLLSIAHLLFIRSGCTIILYTFPAVPTHMA